jgi:replicative DNA helicase
VDAPGPTVSQTCAMGRRMKARYGIGLFIVDHIGKVKPSDRYAGDKNNEMGEVSEALRALGGTLGIPVLALSQLNRAVEGRTDKHPGLADLRDSGSLEQDAHAILFPFRPEYYLKDKCPEAMRGLCEIDVGKNRDGPTGTVNVGFDARTSSWSSRFRED